MPGLNTSKYPIGSRVSQEELAEIQKLLAEGRQSRCIAKVVGRSEFFVWKVKSGRIPFYLRGIKPIPWNKGKAKLPVKELTA